MLTWIEWNTRIERWARWRFQVEQLEEVWSRFKREAGIPRDTPFSTRVPKNCHSRSHMYTPLTWEDLLKADSDVADEVFMLAQRYGYE